jgi:hypothetical protein
MMDRRYLPTSVRFEPFGWLLAAAAQDKLRREASRWRLDHARSERLARAVLERAAFNRDRLITRSPRAKSRGSAEPQAKLLRFAQQKASTSLSPNGSYLVRKALSARDFRSVAPAPKAAH